MKLLWITAATSIATIWFFTRKKTKPAPPIKPSASIQASLEKAAQKTGVPLAMLTSVAYVESRFDPQALSPVGAMGIMQLMPNTAKGLSVADPYNPEQNILGGAKFLASLYKKYGDWDKALAAYNWGPGNVDKSTRLPAQVQGYVDKVRMWA